MTVRGPSVSVFQDAPAVDDRLLRSVPNQLGGIAPGSSTTAPTGWGTLGVAGGSIGGITAVDASSSNNANGARGVAFQQNTSAVASNTTCLRNTLGGIAPGVLCKPVWTYTFSLSHATDSGKVYFAFGFGSGPSPATNATAREESNTAGLSFLSGDTHPRLYGKGGVSLRSTIGAHLAANNPYMLFVDWGAYPSVYVALWDVVAGTWVASATLAVESAGVSIGSFWLYCQTVDGTVVTLETFSVGVNGRSPGSLP